jgi:hypothetical protein
MQTRGANVPADRWEDRAAPVRARPADLSDPPRSGPLAFAPPPWLNRILDVAIVATKAATIACAIDGFLHADTPRLRGKGIRMRAVGYSAGLLLVPAIWRILPDRGRYPRGLDLAVTVPLLLDATGNALGLYETAHLDDVVHFLNAAIVSSIAGALFATRTDEAWQAAMAGSGVAIAGETFWEIAEFAAMKAGADGLDLTYEDTIADMAESAAGAIAGGVVTWLRLPAEHSERRRGWRHALSGWRTSREPIAITGGHGSAAERAIRATG